MSRATNKTRQGYAHDHRLVAVPGPHATPLDPCFFRLAFLGSAIVGILLLFSSFFTFRFAFIARVDLIPAIAFSTVAKIAS